MSLSTTLRVGVTAVALAAASFCAQASTQLVSFNQLVASSTIVTPLGLGDVLTVDTVIVGQTGSLLQNITFTLGAGITAVEGSALWQVSTAGSNLPRLTGFNADILNSANAVALTDNNIVLANGYATSLLSGPIGPGTYTLRLTGTAVRDTVVNVSISAVPEPQTYAMMAVGLALFGVMALRRQHRR